MLVQSAFDDSHSCLMWYVCDALQKVGLHDLTTTVDAHLWVQPKTQQVG